MDLNLKLSGGAVVGQRLVKSTGATSGCCQMDVITSPLLGLSSCCECLFVSTDLGARPPIKEVAGCKAGTCGCTSLGTDPTCDNPRAKPVFKHINFTTNGEPHFPNCFLRATGNRILITTRTGCQVLVRVRVTDPAVMSVLRQFLIVF